MRANGNLAHQPVEGVPVAEDPTAAVEVENRGKQARHVARAHDAQGELPGWARADGAVLAVGLEAQALPGLQARQHGPRFLGRQCMHWRSTLSRELLDEVLDGRVQARNWDVLGCGCGFVHLTWRYASHAKARAARRHYE
jgi:hypothetical protein